MSENEDNVILARESKCAGMAEEKRVIGVTVLIQRLLPLDAEKFRKSVRINENRLRCTGSIHTEIIASHVR